jgi:hypothetical protein
LAAISIFDVIFDVPLQRIQKKGRSKAARSWLVLVPPQIYAKSARKDATKFGQTQPKSDISDFG